MYRESLAVLRLNIFSKDQRKLRNISECSNNFREIKRMKEIIMMPPPNHMHHDYNQHQMSGHERRTSHDTSISILN